MRPQRALLGSAHLTCWMALRWRALCWAGGRGHASGAEREQEPWKTQRLSLDAELWEFAAALEERRARRVVGLDACQEVGGGHRRGGALQAFVTIPS